jgi:hybrid cluster-associated redox disulfide protein
MNTLVLYVLLVALALYSWFAHRRIKNLSKRLDQINDRLYHWGAESRNSFEGLHKAIQGIDLDIKRRAGELRVTSDMLIADVLAIHPRMKEVLAAMHLGGCSSCSTSAAETLGEGAASYDLDTERILEEVNKFLADPDGYEIPESDPHPAPTGVVQIQMPQKM